jgi:hypothetical protein
MLGGLVDAALQLLSGQPTRDFEAEARDTQARAEKHLEPYSRGWRDWYSPYGMSFEPYEHEKVWIWRREWEAPSLVVPRGLDPQMNVIGLLWKPWRESEAVETETRLLTGSGNQPTDSGQAP